MDLRLLPKPAATAEVPTLPSEKHHQKQHVELKLLTRARDKFKRQAPPETEPISLAKGVYSRLAIEHFMYSLLWILTFVVSVGRSPQAGVRRAVSDTRGLRGRALSSVRPLSDLTYNSQLYWACVVASSAMILCYEVMRVAYLFSGRRSKKSETNVYQGDMASSCKLGWIGAVSAASILSVVGFFVSSLLSLFFLLCPNGSFDVEAVTELKVPTLSSAESIKSFFYCIGLIHAALGSGFSIRSLLGAFGDKANLAARRGSYKASVVAALLIPSVIGWVGLRVLATTVLQSKSSNGFANKPSEPINGFWKYLANNLFVLVISVFDYFDSQGMAVVCLWWLGTALMSFLAWDFCDLAITLSSELYHGEIIYPSTTTEIKEEKEPEEGLIIPSKSRRILSKGARREYRDRQKLTAGGTFWNLPVNVACVAAKRLAKPKFG